ncbi:MAG: type II toxin-antitoxin system RelE/ParE family toxin [Simplicispira sp.]|nr:type II toxin-antitoxin system RelE/ParE family toxin [Simplicispira sp.]
MFTVQLTESFQSWLDGLRDIRAQVSIARRIERIAAGNLGDVKSVGEGVSELRVDVGPGYRVYFVQRGGHLVVVLAGGDKASQARDIKRAKQLAKEI